MPLSKCANCGGLSLKWKWEEAFDKFGFGDGDGQIMTEEVYSVLDSAGYLVNFESWILHNTIITSIKQDGKELISEEITIGYDNPREYLPEEIINLLDEKLTD